MIFKNLVTLLVLYFFSSNLYSQEFWNPSNGPFGQGTADIIFDGENEIYCTSYDGIFYSSDNGATWELRWVSPFSYLSSGIRTLAIKNNYLFAGGPGLFRSSDDGLSWEMVKQGPILKIIIHPITGDLFVAELNGVYFSTDDGISWNDITNNLPSRQIWEMGIIQTGEILIGYEFYGLYKSTNYGQEWFRSDTGINSQGVTALTQSGDGTIYAGRGGIFKSTDKGSSWTNVYYDPYGQLLSLETYKDSIVFAGLPQYLIKSTNYGSDWDTSYQAYENNNFINKIKMNSLGEVFTSVKFWGLIKSTDYGSSWARIGLPDGLIENIILSPNSTLFSIAYMAGLFRSTNNGASWEWIDHFGGDLMVDDMGNIYCQRLFYIMRSTDNGLTWVSNYVNANIYKFFYNHNNKIFFATTDRLLYRSSDFGNTWTIINLNFPSISDYVLDSSDNIYIVNDSNLLYKSEDEGMTWNQINTNLPFNIGLSLIDIDDQDKMYLGTNSYSGIPRIYCSSDYGLTWSEYSTGLPDTTSVLSLAINKDNVVYAALANQGVYYLDVINNMWNPVDNSPYIKNVEVLQFDNDGFLYAGTQVHSIIKSRETTVSVDEYLNSNFYFLLSQNYPNPFNPTTTIRYEISERSFVTIKVYDVLGSEVATLVNEEKTIGDYEVEFDGSGLTSGIYFYQLKAGNFVETKKMILLK
jgi:photosystem II stability/assembly factor-like uncharacterized protein